MSANLDSLLRYIPEDAEEQVRQIRDRYNTTIRKMLGQETGLRLRSRNRPDGISVPVKLVPGFPESFAHLDFDDADMLAALVPQYLPSIEKVASGSPDLEELVSRIVEHSADDDFSHQDVIAIKHTRMLAEQLLNQFGMENPVYQILGVNEDVLGVYRYGNASGRSQIELYWAAIALVAELFPVPIESLTYIVMTHELAHAFTHAGTDIDGEKWEDGEFCETDRGLKEGLAQYYTHIICKQANVPGCDVFSAYEQLLCHQLPDYQTHLPWGKNYSPESVRSAMLETRRAGVKALDQFESLLSLAGQRLGTPLEATYQGTGYSDLFG